MFDMLPFSVYGPVLGLFLVVSMSAKPFPPVDFITGLDSYVEHPAVQLVTNAADWNDVWQRHKGITPIGNSKDTAFPSLEKAPRVNFDEDEVLVIFGGLASEGGYKVVDAEKGYKSVVVRIEALPLPGNGSSPSAFKANPYAFIMFPHTSLPITVEVPAGVGQDGTVQWKTVAKVGEKA
jgi:hypothetical protein